jgi:hypothetical protein
MTNETTKQSIPLYRAAHGRTGDKGNRSNISVIAFHPELFSILVEQVTEEAIARQFEDRRPTGIARYILPNLHAMNIVIDDALDGGVNKSMNLDTHGKALAFLLLDMQIEVDSKLLPYLAPAAE